MEGALKSAAYLIGFFILGHFLARIILSYFKLGILREVCDMKLSCRLRYVFYIQPCKKCHDCGRCSYHGAPCKNLSSYDFEDLGRRLMNELKDPNSDYNRDEPV
jgi:uncharacterized protein YqhQ